MKLKSLRARFAKLHLECSPIKAPEFSKVHSALSPRYRRALLAYYRYRVLEDCRAYVGMENDTDLSDGEFHFSSLDYLPREWDSLVCSRLGMRMDDFVNHLISRFGLGIACCVVLEPDWNTSMHKYANECEPCGFDDSCIPF